MPPWGRLGAGWRRLEAVGGGWRRLCLRSDSVGSVREVRGLFLLGRLAEPGRPVTSEEPERRTRIAALEAPLTAI